MSQVEMHSTFLTLGKTSKFALLSLNRNVPVVPLLTLTHAEKLVI